MLISYSDISCLTYPARNGKPLNVRRACVCVSHGDRPSSFVTHSTQIHLKSCFCCWRGTIRMIDESTIWCCVANDVSSFVLWFMQISPFFCSRLLTIEPETRMNWLNVDCRWLVCVCAHGFSPSLRFARTTTFACHFYGKSFRMTFTILFRTCDRYCVFRLPLPVCRTGKRWLERNVRIQESSSIIRIFGACTV